MQQFVNDPLGEPFLVRVLSVISGTTKKYTAEEWHSESITSGLPGTAGPWIKKTGGRQITSDNPGYAIPAGSGSETVLAVGDFAWARSAEGQAGLFWELVPTSSPGVSSAYAPGLFGTYAITPSGVWVTAWTMTLPSAGTYYLFAAVTFIGLVPLVSPSAGQIFARMYDTTHSAEIPPANYSVLVPIRDTYGTGVPITMVGLITVTEPTTISVQAYRQDGGGGTTWGVCEFYDPSGIGTGSGSGYIKLG